MCDCIVHGEQKRVLGAGVTGGFELHGMGVGTKVVSLQEQDVLSH